MSTTIQNAGNMTFQGNAAANQVTTVQEAQNGQGANGNKAPPGTTPAVVVPGDTISGIMAQHGLDWNNPEQREQFLRDNPQFSETGGRNPDLIWAGEVVFVRGGEGQSSDVDGDGTVDPATDTNNDGIPDPVDAQQAAVTTDAAAASVASAEENLTEYMSSPGPKGLRHEFEQSVQDARQRLRNALQAEVETGLETYIQSNPEATPEQIQDEAQRLANAAQGRTTEASQVDDASMDRIVQSAVNRVSAEGRGIDLGRAAPGTAVNDGPYTDEQGPFEPDTTITLRDGTEVAIDEHGYPKSESGAAALAAGASSLTQAQQATSAAGSNHREVVSNTQRQLPEHDEIVSESRKVLTQAVQREIELQLQAWLEENPAASEEQVQAQATEIANGIQEREGVNVVGVSVAASAASQAAEYVLSNRYN